MAKNLNIQKYEDSSSAVFACGEALNKALIENKQNKILLLTSGGSALQVLEELLPEGLSENLSIGVLDERFAMDEKINNFAQMQQTNFFELALQLECSFFGTLPRVGETLEGLTQRMQKALTTWKQENTNGKIFATLGMGPDGHTAGIFPLSDEMKFKNLFENKNWVTGYSAETKYKERVTTTLTFFENIDEGFSLVCGSEKKPVLNRLILDKEKVNQLPALGWNKIGKVTVFTDNI